MTVVEIVARARVSRGACAEQLVCHPRLPLVAGLDSERPAVYIWDSSAGQLRELGTTGGGSPAYGDGHPWALRNPEVAVNWDRRERCPLWPGTQTSPCSSWRARARWPGGRLTDSLRWTGFRPEPPTAGWRSARTASPAYPYPREWLEQMRAWSKHNIAFGVQPGVLWVGTPTGTLVEIDLDHQQATGHDVLAGSKVNALCATAAGDLVVATGEGDLVLASVLTESAESQAADVRTPQALVTAFLGATSEVPDDGDLEAHLVVTNGPRTWEPDDLGTVTTAAETDPTWLQLRAAINNTFAQEE
jgi:hypothetical protein